MPTIRRIAMLCLLASYPTALVSAEEFEDNVKTFKELSDTQLEKYLLEIRLTKVERGEPEKDGTTLFRVWNEKELFGVLHDRKNRQVRMYAMFERSAGTEREKLEIVNAWNGTNRFSKAMITENRTWVLEGKIDYRSGTSNFVVIGAVEEFALKTMPNYLDFVQLRLPKR